MILKLRLTYRLGCWFIAWWQAAAQIDGFGLQHEVQSIHQRPDILSFHSYKKTPSFLQTSDLRSGEMVW